VFDPDRFSSERFASIDRWQYLPFSAGPHSCMGDHFAMLEAILALATIARDVEITCETTDFPTKTALLKTPAGAVPARVRPRN
jgi:cytochrome P450